MVRKKELLEYAAHKALEETQRRGLETSDKEQLVAQAQNIIEDLFLSTGWKEIEAGEDKPEPLTVWRHRTIDDQEADWRSMSFAKAELQNAVERYLDAPWLQCREIDWLALNLLTYAAYQATLDSVRTRTLPMGRYLSRKMDSTGFRIGAELWRAALFLLKCIAWIIIFAATSPASPLGPLIWIFLTLGWLWRKWTIRKKNKNTLDSMRNTYATFSAADQNWQEAWKALEESREQGAVWDGLIYRLVEERRQQILHPDKIPDSLPNRVAMGGLESEPPNPVL